MNPKTPDRPPRGIALVMVMMLILVLGIMAAGFAFTMRVEMRLGANTSRRPDMEWLGRSGMELARFVLAEQKRIPGDMQFDALSQMWAGGPLGTNEVLALVSLSDVRLGQGSFDVEIRDLERRFNINLADEHFLRMTEQMMGVDLSSQGLIADSILDWRDPDSVMRDNGAETDHYLESPNFPFSPHVAKNGPIDDLSELLLIRGVTPRIYYGGSGSQAPPVNHASPGSPGFDDLFTTIGGPRINVNTASPLVLKLALRAAVPDPMMDEIAGLLLERRRGLDGIDGTYDDIPFRTLQGLGKTLVTLNQSLASADLSRLLNVQSSFFEVTITTRLGEYVRTWQALLLRQGTRNVHVLRFHAL